MYIPPPFPWSFAVKTAGFRRGLHFIFQFWLHGFFTRRSSAPYVVSTWTKYVDVYSTGSDVDGGGVTRQQPG